MNAISKDEKTPVMLAADVGYAELVQELFYYRADPKISKYEPRKSSGLVAELRHRQIRHL